MTPSSAEHDPGADRFSVGLGSTAPAAALAGRYHLRELLGVGGSASVFRAVDVAQHPSEAVAVKILHPHLCSTEQARTAFLREAQRSARVQHPNIARILDSGLHESGGVVQAWIALELVQGGSLTDRVRRLGPMTPAESAIVICAVLEALGAAHEAGLVHRDVSPSNILLRTSVRDEALRPQDICLVDFGLADVTGRDATGGDVLRVSSGRGVIGNANYLSPEQASGLAVTAAGDVYQTGGVLHFLLTGQAPYPRGDTAQTIHAHVSAPPPVPSSLEPGARCLDRVVTRAMAKDPSQRYADVHAFQRELRSAVAASAQTQSWTGRTQVTRWLPTGEQSGLRTPSLAPMAAQTGAAGAAAVRGRTSVALSSPGSAVAVLIALLSIIVLSIALTGWFATAVDRVREPTTAPAALPTDEPSRAADAPDETVPLAAPPTPEPPPAIDVEDTAVPALSGTLVDAQALLARSGLSVGAVTRVESARPQGQVLDQWPAAGTSLAPGGTVDVVIASGRNIVPSVTGLDVPSAAATLLSAGFTASAGSASAGAVVVATDPAAGSIVLLGSRIELQFGVVGPTPGPTETLSPPDPG